MDKVAIVILDDNNRPGRGKVASTHVTYASARRAVHLDKDGCVDESVRFWRVSSDVRPGQIVTLKGG